VDHKYEPDVVVLNPKKSPIFEITGFEFSESNSHTATDDKGKGLSIRFPRVTRIRDDKKYKDATSLTELRVLVKTSRENPGAMMGKKRKASEDAKDAPVEKKKKTAPPKPKPKISDYKAKSDDAPKKKKRKLDSKATSPPKKKKKLAKDPRKKCRHGLKCYRRKLEHFEEYRHDDFVADEDYSFEPDFKIASVIRLEEWHDLQKVKKASLEEAAKQEETKMYDKVDEDFQLACKKAKQEYEEALKKLEAEKELAHAKANGDFRQEMDKLGKLWSLVEKKYDELNEDLS